MVPTIAHLLSAMTRSLEDVIVPAIAPGNSAATQQAHVCIAVLKTIAAQHDKVYHLALTELRLYLRFVRAVTQGDCSAIEPVLRARMQQAAATQPWGELQIPQIAAIEAVARELRELADAIVAQPSLRSDPALDARVRSAARELARDETILRRSWMASIGAEADRDALPSIADLVAPCVSPAQRDEPACAPE